MNQREKSHCQSREVREQKSSKRVHYDAKDSVCSARTFSSAGSFGIDFCLMGSNEFAYSHPLMMGRSEEGSVRGRMVRMNLEVEKEWESKKIACCLNEVRFISLCRMAVCVEALLMEGWRQTRGKRKGRETGVMARRFRVSLLQLDWIKSELIVPEQHTRLVPSRSHFSSLLSSPFRAF